MSGYLWTGDAPSVVYYAVGLIGLAMYAGWLRRRNAANETGGKVGMGTQGNRRLADEPGKLRQLLTSRKFWASLLGLGGVLSVHFGYRELPVEDLTNAILTLVAVFVGATAVEDGLRGKG